MAYTNMDNIPAFDFFKLLFKAPANLPIGPILEQADMGVRNIVAAQMALVREILQTNLMIVEACFSRVDGERRVGPDTKSAGGA